MIIDTVLVWSSYALFSVFGTVCLGMWDYFLALYSLACVNDFFFLFLSLFSPIEDLCSIFSTSDKQVALHSLIIWICLHFFCFFGPRSSIINSLHPSNWLVHYGRVHWGTHDTNKARTSIRTARHLCTPSSSMALWRLSFPKRPLLACGACSMGHTPQAIPIHRIDES